MFLILCFIDKKIFVYSEIEIKSKVDKKTKKIKRIQCLRIFQIYDQNKIGKAERVFY